MLTKPIQGAPVTRGLPGASPAPAGADLSYFWPYPFPAEGADQSVMGIGPMLWPAEGTDQAWVGLWCCGAPAEGVDQSFTPWVMPAEGADQSMMWHLPPFEGVDQSSAPFSVNSSEGADA